MILRIFERFNKTYLENYVVNLPSNLKYLSIDYLAEHDVDVINYLPNSIKSLEIRKYSAKNLICHSNLTHLRIIDSSIENIVDLPLSLVYLEIGGGYNGDKKDIKIWLSSLPTLKYCEIRGGKFILQMGVNNSEICFESKLYEARYKSTLTYDFNESITIDNLKQKSSDAIELVL